MTTVKSSGQASGTMRRKIRGVEIKAHPIPVQFVFGKAIFAENALGNVDTLVKHLRHEEPDQVILVGHTDHIGSKKNNCKLSVRRAQALKKHLVKAGIRANITTIGKGEYEPVKLYEPNRYIN
jgi:outer membrane protein OmpA-like peptidoglycan-associated protein